MKRTTAILFLLSVVVMMIAAVCAVGGQTSGMAFRTFTVEGRSVQGQLRGPWEWTGGVTVKGSALTLTADSLKVWPTPDGRDADKVEATGNITVEGQYVAPDKTTWEIAGKAASASYERAAAEGVMRGSVSFRAVNPATGAIVSAVADTMTYNFKTQQFRFERGEKPVRMEWQEPAPPAAAQPEAQKSKEASAEAGK
jgi:lipopolysaccharide export system protein LptA